ncbi:MAG: cation transporter [Candidatus Bipolaricaulota bacterium]|nr:MAG: cation transporter [Candidatus Bipolaricaulota bacterium]
MSGHHGHEHTPTRRIGVALGLNLTFTVIELVGGLLTNSVAVLSDAVHDLGDTISLVLAWRLTRLAERRGDETFSYGYRRFSLLSALVVSAVLIAGGVAVLTEAIPRMTSPRMPHVGGMLAIALLGIAVNGAAALRMRGGRTLNERIVTWHFLEDVLGWVAVLIVSIVMSFRPVPILDPALSVLITVYVLWNVIRHLKRTFTVLLQGVPGGMRLAEIEDRMRAVDGVCDVHHTHVWSQDGERHVLTTHVVPDRAETISEAASLRERLRAELRAIGIRHATIEVETTDSCYCAEHEGECR